MPTIPVLRCASGVEFARIAPGGFRILAALDGASKALGVDLTLTAGTNDHSGTDPHVRGEAYDVRVRDLDSAHIVRLYRYLQATLGERFTVLYESPNQPSDPSLQAIVYLNPHATGPHIHCQVAKGTTYPPPEATTGLRA